ncbi:MAG TPA: PIG-L family deacetylase [Kiritimatiellia bacterium]|nr:PIG-L family deacetylase [Kiritimatiellia bacterium]
MKRLGLILAPHPDDECITGLLPLRLQEEAGFTICAVPVTLGSNRARQAARRKEFIAACAVLGFKPLAMPSGAPEEAIAKLLCRWQPGILLMPHSRDGHPTHRQVHRWGVAALDAVGGSWRVVETEYWHPLTRPNLLVAAGRGQLARLRRALACHVGEIARNDYAARLPAWMSDNVRRGAELVGAPGAAAPRVAQATLYRARIRAGGRWQPAPRGRFIVSRQNLCDWLAAWD